MKHVNGICDFALMLLGFDSARWTEYQTDPFLKSSVINSAQLIIVQKAPELTIKQKVCDSRHTQLSVVHIKQVNLEKNNELFVGTNETVHYTGLLIFRVVADPRNSAKFPKKCEIPRNPPEIFPNTCRQSIFNTYLSYQTCFIHPKPQIYLETSSLQRVNNVPKLPGVLD